MFTIKALFDEFKIIANINKIDENLVIEFDQWDTEKRS